MDIYEREFLVSKTNERTLVVGAAARKYNANPHIHYYICGKENKDYDRIIRPTLREICQQLRLRLTRRTEGSFFHRRGPDVHAHG